MLSAHGLKPSPSRGGLGEWVSPPRPRTGSCRGRSPDLLLPQRFDRVQLRGLARRVVAEEQAGADREHRRQREHLPFNATGSSLNLPTSSRSEEPPSELQSTM